MTEIALATIRAVAPIGSLAFAVVLGLMAWAVPAAPAMAWTSVTTDPFDYNRASRSSGSGYATSESGSRKTRAARINSDGDDEQPKKRVRVAALGGGDYSAPPPKTSGGYVTWAASGGCLPGSLKSVIAQVAQYGSVTVSSTHRSASHNARVGGASQSYHLSCQAADFRVHGAVASAASFLRNHPSVGGFHHYGGGLFHIDTGPKRTW